MNVSIEGEGLPIWTKIYPILVRRVEESNKSKITPLGPSLSQVVLDNKVTNLRPSMMKSAQLLGMQAKSIQLNDNAPRK